MSIYALILTANSLISTTYGYSEMRCGDIGQARPCEKGAITASGIEFDPEIPMAAIAAPTHLRLEAMQIYLKVQGGRCKPVQLLDKMNPRYIGIRGFDLTPAAVRLLTGKEPTPYWSDRVYVCRAPGRDPLWEGPVNIDRLAN